MNIYLDVDGVQSANVIEIPVFLKPRLQAGSGQYYFLLGPDLLIILGDITYKEQADGAEREAGVSPDKSYALGLSLSFGYEFRLGFAELSAELRYTRSLNEVFDNFRAFNHFVTIIVGYGYIF